jgi:histidinol-phosphate/aromatic aminotransferase/cobyric acid decarboxylase-like protein
MQAYFRDLLINYPSGLNTQNLLGAKLYNVDENSILVGNGAAELIKALSVQIKGSIGIPFPSFNEYSNSFSHNNNEVVPLSPKDFNYGIADLLELSKKCDNLLLINPDNPSGNFINKNDIISLLDNMKAENKTLILDESFSDFSINTRDATFITQSFLDTYPNLIVIKYLSKSYGVPGIRLGLLASSNKTIISNIRNELPIWNINSFGEFFLQIIGKYKKEYNIACKSICAERERFSSMLSNTKLLKVYPSSANYLLCEVQTGSASDLAKYLLEEHEIFIKDLTGKQGIRGDKYIRLAIRNEKDNDYFIECIKGYHTHTR